MLKSGILNPHILDLLARVRHTNTLVIADWAFPYWPELETVDICLTHGIPTVLDVLNALAPTFKIGRIWQAEEFPTVNPADEVAKFERGLAAVDGAEIVKLPHVDFKAMIPHAIGLIRTGDCAPYTNLIIESA